MKTRLYSFVNLYLNGTQAGIQTAHAAVDLVHQCSQSLRPTAKANQLCDQWAGKDKTIIVLDGGYQSNLEKLYGMMLKMPSYPCAKFHEEQEALNGALTCVCIVLPDYMYDRALYNPNSSDDGVVSTARDPETLAVIHNYSGPEQEFILATKHLRLKS